MDHASLKTVIAILVYIMSLAWITDALAGKHKQYELLPQDIDAALTKHAEEGMSRYYEGEGRKLNTEWDDITEEIVRGGAALKNDESWDAFQQGLGLLPRIAEGVRKGQMYDIDDSAYTVFYFEPTHQTSVVEETDGTKFLAPAYIIGETFEYNYLGDEDKTYTIAELRSPGESLEKSLERPLSRM